MKSYHLAMYAMSVSDSELLKEEFLRHGRKQGLSDDFLEKVLDYLLKNQFYPSGERDPIRQELLRMITQQIRGD